MYPYQWADTLDSQGRYVFFDVYYTATSPTPPPTPTPPPPGTLPGATCGPGGLGGILVNKVPPSSTKFFKLSMGRKWPTR